MNNGSVHLESVTVLGTDNLLVLCLSGCDGGLLCELVPYAWDEPTAPPHISLRVQSGTSATYDMNTVGDGEKLYYENFIYIAFTHTFRRYLLFIH